MLPERHSVFVLFFLALSFYNLYFYSNYNLVPTNCHFMSFFLFVNFIVSNPVVPLFYFSTSAVGARGGSLLLARDEYVGQYFDKNVDLKEMLLEAFVGSTAIVHTTNSLLIPKLQKNK